VEIEDHRFVEREQAVEVLVAQAKRVFTVGREFVQVYQADETYLQVWDVFPLVMGFLRYQRGMTGRRY
jgi:hypothetical protein